MHAMAANVAGVIGSAIAAGMRWSVMLYPDPHAQLRQQRVDSTNL